MSALSARTCFESWMPVVNGWRQLMTRRSMLRQTFSWRWHKIFQSRRMTSAGLRKKLTKSKSIKQKYLQIIMLKRH